MGNGSSESGLLETLRQRIPRSRCPFPFLNEPASALTMVRIATTRKDDERVKILNWTVRFGHIKPSISFILAISFHLSFHNSHSRTTYRRRRRRQRHSFSNSPLIPPSTCRSFQHLAAPHSQTKKLCGLQIFKMSRPDPPLTVRNLQMRVTRPITYKERQAINAMHAWDFNLQNPLSLQKSRASVSSLSVGPRNESTKPIELKSFEPKPLDDKKEGYSISEEMVFEEKEQNERIQSSKMNALGLPWRLCGMHFDWRWIS